MSVTFSAFMVLCKPPTPNYFQNIIPTPKVNPYPFSRQPLSLSPFSP